MDSTHSHIGQELRLVDLHNCFNRLEFNNHRTFHEKVNAIRRRHWVSFIYNWQLALTLELDACQCKLFAKAFLVSAFKKSRSKFSMHLYR